MGDLRGRRALVTGGGTGIGFGCAERLVAAGAAVTIAGRRQDVLDDAAGRLGGDITTVACDVTDEEQVEHAVTVAAAGKNLDVLVANAGSGFPGAVSELGPEAWEFCFRLNVVGTALCTKHASAVMREHGGGSIVAISSTSGTKVQPWLAPYVVSKAALDMFVRCAAIELSPHAIRVNSVQPGYVATETMEAAASDELHGTLVRATPLPREGTPADIGNAVVFLATDEGSWITGQDFGVDGGLNIPVMPSMAAIAERLYGADTVREVGLPDFTALNVEGDRP
ncbi:SDR family NAD(P)-dependent oxidoreductase [Rhabdothermincola salaria]|uniref:SDR family NAD(P)-dependent oxidoreductase n=1 Tax=Rhabdothermincola salaria TaxID=2903142 RepID=UPI001E5FB5DC|nr:SDR family oxidoreductase [Rhabdothermincola salaria]MCD9624260.1 SDR family oxidoreductase [Rhabdothermincola salaria]